MTTPPTIPNNRCPQCSKLMTLEEMKHNACDSCYNAIGDILKTNVVVVSDAPLTYVRTTPLEGESHD